MDNLEIKKKILILYTELAGYTVTCLQKVREMYPNVELYVVSWPVNKEAPFQFDFEGIQHYYKTEFKNSELFEKIISIAPDCIVASGWIDKEYNKICKHYKSKIPVVVTLDNHWRGNLKQLGASVLSSIFVRNKFNLAWVPGDKQYKFARKLGFKDREIFKGFYAANTSMFSAYYKLSKPIKESNYPKRLLYVGRYVEHKGIFDMWNAFLEVQEESPSEWELICVGTGEQWENRIIHPKIKHLGFLQPDEFQKIIDETSIYILPSHFEPWGVSLHEFTTAGYPVLVSDAVGAAEQFCKSSKNGFIFENRNLKDMKQKLKKMMSLTQKDWISMRNYSIELSLQISPTKWAETLIKMSNGKN